MGANQNARKLLSTDLVNTKRYCFLALQILLYLSGTMWTVIGCFSSLYSKVQTAWLCGVLSSSIQFPRDDYNKHLTNFVFLVHAAVVRYGTLFWNKLGYWEVDRSATSLTAIVDNRYCRIIMRANILISTVEPPISGHPWDRGLVSVYGRCPPTGGWEKSCTRGHIMHQNKHFRTLRPFVTVLFIKGLLDVAFLLYCTYIL